MADYLQRLALALPLICLMAVAVLIGWQRLQRRGGGRALSGAVPAWLRPGRSAADGRVAKSARPMEILASEAVQPGVRLCVVRFGGVDRLLAVSATAAVVLADTSADAGDAQPHDIAGAAPDPHGQPGWIRLAGARA